MTSDDRETTSRRIEICLLLIELSMAVAMAMSAYVVLKVLPFSTSWIAGIFSTVIGLWIIKSTIWTLQSLKKRSVYDEGSNMTSGLPWDDENNSLKSFELRQKTRMKSYSEDHPRGERVMLDAGEKDEDGGSNNIPLPSKVINEAKKFLTESNEGKYTSKISFPLLAILATVLLHCAVRLLVIVQKFMRYFRFLSRGRSQRSGFIKFSDIPFTVGKSASTSGFPFQIFSFLNEWLHCNGNDYSLGGGSSPGVHEDQKMELQAVSFNQISINSSSFIINPPGKHPAAKSQSSWLGVAFEDIDMSLTILLKRKGRRIFDGGHTEEGESINDACIQSMTIRLKMRALEIGVFPCSLDWCKGVGIQIDANATFDDTRSDSDKQSSLSGFGMSTALRQFTFYRFASCVSLEEGEANSQDRVFSWDKIQSSLHLLNDSNGGHSRRDMASFLAFPSGFLVSRVTRQRNATIESSSTPPLSNHVYVNLGGLLCENRFALGVNVADIQHFIRSMDILLQNMSFSLISGPSTETDTCTSNKETSKNKSSIEVVQLDAAISTHVYTLLSQNGAKNAACLDCFSFGAPYSVLHWRNDITSVPDAEACPIAENAEQRCDGVKPLLVADARDVSLRYEAYPGGRLDDGSIIALDLILFKRIKSNSAGQKCTTIDLGGIVARIDGEVVNKLACTKRLSEDVKLAAFNLRCNAKNMKQAISGRTKQNLNQNSKAADQNRRRDMLSRIDISCDSVDAIIEFSERGLHKSRENTGSSPQGDTTNDSEVRVAGLLNRGVNVTVWRNCGSNQEEQILSMNNANSDSSQPDQLFDSEVRNCAQHYLFEAAAVTVEGSLTFVPHSSLPVVSLDESWKNKETSIYWRAKTTTFRSTIPLKHLEMNSVTRPPFSTRAISANFDELQIYERYSEVADAGMPIFSIPVHEFSFSSNFSESYHSGWPMAQTYTQLISADLVRIGQCNGGFCRVEKRNDTTGEKTETISIRFTSSWGLTEVEILWSPIIQWILSSGINRIQRALAYTKTLASKTPKVRKLSSHKTNIRIEVDSNVTANINIFPGVKSLVHTIIYGGSTMNISTAKYPSPSSTSLKQTTKPNISFHAKRIELLLNNIASSICTFEDISLQNFLRRADENDLNEYTSKKEKSSDVNSDDLATDEDGYPSKEIFELEIGNMTAKFPPILHFGEVIDDFALMPKALAVGLNQLKGGQKKRSKKYQLMTIKCIIPFLDMSLMCHDPDAEHSTPTKQTILREEFRICFEAAELSIERNTPLEWTQSQLNALDEDDSSTYVYGPAIKGGLICLTVQHVFCTLHPLNLATPLVRIDDFAINGYLHLTGLSPVNPGIQEAEEKSFLLLCHHNSSKVICAPSTENHRQCCCYGVSLPSAGIPVKLYTDSRITCGGLDISWGPIMKSCMPRFKESIKKVIPPPKSSSSEVAPEPLSWWDNVRFFVHGSISVSANHLSFCWLLDSHIFRDRSIIFNLQNCVISHTVGFFGVDASDINISIPGTGYDMSVHPSERDMKPSVHLPHSTESAVTRGRHPLIYIPSFKTEIKFVWNMLLPGRFSSDHHYIYKKHETEVNSIENNCATRDKFAPFRSDGTDIEVDLELLGSTVCDNWVALRIDCLPWFTHLNSSMTYTEEDEDKAKPFPEVRSAAIKASTSKLRLATWFADEEDFDSLCLIVKRVNYNATGCGSKEIVIEGPVKAALLDVTEFKHEENVVGDVEENYDIMDMEYAASEFGVTQNENISEVDDHSSQTDSFPREKESTPFLKLQQLSSDIEELDYVVVTGQIDIRNQSLTRMLAGCRDATKAATAHENFERTESQNFAGLDRTTWSILVSRLKLLWTIEIRDSLMAISKDLIYTIGFMKSQKRQLQVLSGDTSSDPDHSGESSRDTAISLSGAGEGVEISLPDPQRTGSAMNDSVLEYLLRESSKSFEKESFDKDLASMPNTNQGDVSAATGSPAEVEENEGKTLPTLDIQFANPQIQLHSIATGGSIILAMEGAHVEGCKFVHFVVSNAHRKTAGKVSLSDLLRKTEHTYTLTNMEAYSLSTHVDPNVGLPWLDVCSSYNSPGYQAVALEERFGINSNENHDATSWNHEEKHGQQLGNEHECSTSSQKYPSYLRHHEPLAFAKSGLLRPILDQFTFQSKQLFHRPPIHYSIEELICFVKEGLVVDQDEAVDDIKLQIDLLKFNLDSYQFKTTLDVIRNVLLEPPKPHQRHQSFDKEETDDASKERRISSVAATEMEEVLRNHDKHRGKKGRQILRSAAMNLLQDLEDRIALDGNEVFRRISYTLSKLTWSIQSQGEQLDDVQIAFTGFNGQHDYSRDGSIVSQFSLEDLRVSSSRPGPDSIGFSDPTSVVKSVLGNKRSPCQRCGNYFDHSENDLTSCRFHVGQFKSGVWTCCNSTNATAPGCKSGPHTGKELAAVVRVESLPRIVEGISLFTHVEVNLFPGVLHTLVVQISKSMSRLFMSYFFVGDDNDDYTDDMSTFSDVSGSTDAISVQSEYSPKPPSRSKKMLVGVKESPSAEEVSESTELDDILSELNPPKEEPKKSEIAFIKVWRIGYVDVNVSFGGFKRFPQTLDLSVPAYSKAYKIGTWEYLGRKYLTYLLHEVVKSGASSGLDKLFRRKVVVSPSPGLRGDQLEQRSLEASSYQRSAPPLPSISDSGPVDLESFIGRHLRRPMGASDILGTPAKNAPKKKKKMAFKHKDRR